MPTNSHSEHHTDDRTPLGYAYEGDELVAILYTPKALRECMNGWPTVVPTPEGEQYVEE